MLCPALGEEESDIEKDYTYGYKIFLHERGQFWPGVDMTRLGQTESIYLKTKTRLEGKFQLVERRVLNTPARPCQEDQSYSFTRCLLEFVAARVGCHLDWVGTHRLAKYPPCRSLEEIKKYSDLLEEIMEYSFVRLTRETGCYVKCHYKEYKFNRVKHVQISREFSLVGCVGILGSYWLDHNGIRHSALSCIFRAQECCGQYHGPRI